MQNLALHGKLKNTLPCDLIKLSAWSKQEITFYDLEKLSYWMHVISLLQQSKELCSDQWF